MIIAVTGITGHTGCFFLKELEQHSFDGIVRCLVRTSSGTEMIDRSPLNIEKVIGDNTDYESLRKLTQNVDVVMHIFSIKQSVNVLNAAIENNVSRVVMVHTTGVYSKYKMASEEYKKIENEIEKILSKHCLDVTILRPTMIFGDMCDHNIHKFIEMVDKFPVMPEIDAGRGKIRPVNARDLAKAYYKVCMTNRLPNIYYDLSGEQSITLHELFDMIGSFLGKNMKYQNIPMWLGVFLAKCIKLISFGKLNFVEKVLRMGENRDYGHEMATRDFSYMPESFVVGLKREVEEYRMQRKQK